MKHIYLNLKRFDIPKALGGVNGISGVDTWAKDIVESVEGAIRKYDGDEFVFFFPEAHLMSAKRARGKNSPVKLGSQGLYWEDTEVNGPFGAFTTSLTGNAAVSIGCEYTIIGHCEERKKLYQILGEAGLEDSKVISRIMNKEALAAQKAGLKVLYCVGEKEEELPLWDSVIKEQLDLGLKDLDLKEVVIAYEPIWSIGPGKKAADEEYINKIASLIKTHTGDLNVVYGGGLKEENAKQIASIESIDGGLIALTRFKGDIGFYSEEYVRIVETYLGGSK